VATTRTNFLRSLRACIVLCLTLCLSLVTKGQVSIDSLLEKVDPQKWFASIEKKAGSIGEKLTAKSTKTLNRLQKQEEKLYRRMLRSKDSAQAREALTNIRVKYEGMREKLNNRSTIAGASQYISKLDTLSTTLKFLEQNGAGGKVKDALEKTAALQNKFQQTEEVQKFINERKQQLKEQLEKLGMVKQLKKFNKEVYYYSAQIKEYKELLKDSKKVEKKALELLSKTKLFKDFFRRNSQLASLFRLPGDPGDPSSQASLAGLQTRAQVNNLIQQQIATGGPGAQQQVSQNMQASQAQLTQLKDRVLKAGGNGSDDELPDFKPNKQKTKSFFQRLEYGTNVQTQKASNYFPVTSDIGLSVGYKLNDKSVIGVGASYKMGWGRGWRDLTITHQGIGLRSYVDIKIKGSFWISGGYEQNYRASFNSIEQLQDLNAWQRSGLIGLSKVVLLKTKFFKKTKVQLLWDMLSYEQMPRTQPIVFRIGYNF
jgi:hypothetical protein